jgi:hypothetical protein
LEDLSALNAGTYQLQITDANGCQVGDSFQVANLLSTGTLNESASIIGIYPNPNNGSFYITIPLDEVYQLTIFDMQGRLISAEQLTGSTWLSTQLPTGKYMAVFNAPQKQTTCSFLVY